LKQTTFLQTYSTLVQVNSDVSGIAGASFFDL
jgi:hypothetical protein